MQKQFRKKKRNKQFTVDKTFEISISDLDLLERIGEGGFSTVHKARSKSNRSILAVKILKQQADADRSPPRLPKSKPSTCCRAAKPSRSAAICATRRRFIAHITTELVSLRDTGRKEPPAPQLPAKEQAIFSLHAVAALAYGGPNGGPSKSRHAPQGALAAARRLLR